MKCSARRRTACFEPCPTVNLDFIVQMNGPKTVNRLCRRFLFPIAVNGSPLRRPVISCGIP